MTAITILPGYGKSPALFQADARPRRVRIEVNGGAPVEQELRDASEPRRLPLPASAPATSVEVTVLSVWPGKRFEDMCIAEILRRGAHLKACASWIARAGS